MRGRPFSGLAGQIEVVYAHIKRGAKYYTLSAHLHTSQMDSPVIKVEYKGNNLRLGHRKDLKRGHSRGFSLTSVHSHQNDHHTPQYKHERSEGSAYQRTRTTSRIQPPPPCTPLDPAGYRSSSKYRDSPRTERPHEGLAYALRSPAVAPTRGKDSDAKNRRQEAHSSTPAESVHPTSRRTGSVTTNGGYHEDQSRGRGPEVSHRDPPGVSPRHEDRGRFEADGRSGRSASASASLRNPTSPWYHPPHSKLHVTREPGRLVVVQKI